MGMAITWGYTSGIAGLDNDLSVADLRFLPLPSLPLDPDSPLLPPAVEPRSSPDLLCGMGSGAFDFASSSSPSCRVALVSSEPFAFLSLGLFCDSAGGFGCSSFRFIEEYEKARVEAGW
jgi:hypothetical protein